MTRTALSIGIAGAGLLGRLLAWRLARVGHRVSAFDISTGPEAVPRGRAPEPYVPTAAGFTAAGMLSPLSELDNAEPRVAALGWRSLALWPRIAAALPGKPNVSVLGSVLLAHGADLGAAQRVLDRLQAAVHSDIWQQVSPTEPVRALNTQELRALEPSIEGPTHGWLLPGEGHIDTVATMDALYAAAAGVDWRWSSRVVGIDAGERGGTLRFADGKARAFDAVIDVRGVGAKPDLPVRGVRGEVIWLALPHHGLRRPVRLLHPRHKVYLVPRTPDIVLVGASEIESEDRSPVSLRTAVELMAAAHSIMPALAEARILKLDVNLRPALPDNNPRVDLAPHFLRINGLFRHGWLLSAALVDQALRDTGWCPEGLELNDEPAHAGALP